MKIYRRYLAREVSGAILLVLVAFLALFGFFDMINEVKNVGSSASYQLHHAIVFVLLRVPGRMSRSMRGGGAVHLVIPSSRLSAPP